MLLALAMAAAMLTMTSCGSDDDEEKMADYPVTVSGVKFVGAPSKVVCLSSTYIGIIYAMGFEKQLIGRTADCDYTEAEAIQAFGTVEKPAV